MYKDYDKIFCMSALGLSWIIPRNGKSIGGDQNCDTYFAFCVFSIFSRFMFLFNIVPLMAKTDLDINAIFIRRGLVEVIFECEDSPP